MQCAHCPRQPSAVRGSHAGCASKQGAGRARAHRRLDDASPSSRDWHSGHLRTPPEPIHGARRRCELAMACWQAERLHERLAWQPGAGARAQSQRCAGRPRANADGVSAPHQLTAVTGMPRWRPCSTHASCICRTCAHAPRSVPPVPAAKQAFSSRSGQSTLLAVCDSQGVGERAVPPVVWYVTPHTASASSRALRALHTATCAALTNKSHRCDVGRGRQAVGKRTPLICAQPQQVTTGARGARRRCPRPRQLHRRTPRRPAGRTRRHWRAAQARAGSPARPPPPAAGGPLHA